MHRLVLKLIVLLIVIVVGSVYWLMATESGFKALITQSQNWLPELTIGQAQGRLSDEIQLHTVRYQADEFTVIDVDSVLLNWQLLDLLSGKLQLNVLAADGITISQTGNKPQQAPTEQISLPTIALPFDIYLDAMTVTNVSMINADVTTPLFNRLDASITLEQSKLTIKQLYLNRSDTDHIDITGQVMLTDAYATQLNYQWAAQLPNINPLAGTGTIEGDVAELHVQQQLISPIASSQTIVLKNIIDNIQWQADIAIAKLTITDFAPQQAGVASDIKLTAHGDLAGAKADLSATFTHPQLSTVTLNTYAESTDFDHWQITSNIITPTTMAISLDATLLDTLSKPSAKLVLNWQDLAWPVINEAKIMSSRQGRLTVDGNLEQFALQLNADLEAQSQHATLVASAHGNDQKIKLTELTLNGLGGKVQFVGEVLLQSLTSLNGQLRMTNINPGLMAADWPGKLSGGLALSASLSDKSPNLTVKQLDITGKLRDRPLKLQGGLAYIDSRLTIPALQLYSGKSSLDIKGSFQDNIAIDWQLNSPDLVDFYPDLSGELVGSGKVTGSVAQPIYSAKLSGQHIAYDHVVSIAKLASEITLDMSQQGLVDAHVSIDNLSAESVSNINSQLSLSGTQAAHQLTLNVSNESVDVSTIINGGMAKERWKGQLEQLDLKLADSTSWTLTEYNEITLGTDSVNVGQQCLTSEQSAVCIVAKYSQQQWQARGSLDNFAINKLHGALEQLEPLTGDINGQFDIAAKGTYPTSGKGQFNIKNGRIDLTKSTLDSNSIIDLTEAKLSYELTDNTTHAFITLAPKLDGVSTITGSLLTSDIATLVESPELAPLEGHFETAIDDLSVFDAITADYENLKGQLKADIRLTGSVKAPLAQGTVFIDNTSVDIPSAGLSLKQIKAQAEGGLENGFNVSFAAQSGKGDITGTGNVVFTDTKWRVNSHIKGSNFEVINTPELYAIASPDITMTLDEQAMNITGSLTIPEADIQPTQFNSSVSASKDVVVITQEQSNEASAFPTHINVQLILGDKINLTALGFKARLTGDLLTTGNASEQLQGKGQIVIKEGVYNAYGKKLTINDGKILFTGGPIDNPGLDIKAIKRSDEYLVGIQISGLADAPDIKLFSDPSMSDDEILAYLVLGKPLAQASVADAAILASAAAGFGGNGEGIAQKFGLDKLEIEGEGKEDASVELGKNLSPNLYVGYGIGIFDPVNTVNIRYQLSKIWSLRAESGQESGIDLLYTHER